MPDVARRTPSIGALMLPQEAVAPARLLIGNVGGTTLCARRLAIGTQP